MRRNCPFLLIGLAIVSGVSSGCGGDEFGTVDPGSQNDRDGAADGTSPRIDGSSSGGSGGVGGTGGAGGSGAGGGGSGAGGTGGTAGKGGGSGSGGGKGGSDAAPDVILFDVSDGRADAGRAGDVSDAQVVDGPSGSDGPGDSAADNGRDSSISPDAAGSDVVCSEPITYYKDSDGDGFGVSTESTTTCTPPGIHWSVLTGDCRDDLPNVKPYSVGSPDPPVYSSVGYADMAKPQGVSFDYDCNGNEEGDPSNAPSGPEPACSGPLDCTGAGYMAVNPARTGNGINPQCGSTTIKRCTLLFANGAPALCSSTLEVAAPYMCR